MTHRERDPLSLLFLLALLAVLLPGTAAGQLGPGSLCPPTPTPTDGFWISSSNTNQIFRFSADGTPLGPLAIPNLSHPRSITVTPGGEVWIASQFSSTIVVCDLDGNFSDAFTVPGLAQPTGAAIGPNGHYYICSFSNDTILEVDPATESLIATHVSPGLDAPNCIVFRPDGGFFVTGQASNDVHSFSAAGAALGSFPTGQSSVMGAALDHSGRLLVAGGGSSEVRVFDCDGNVLETWPIAGGPQSIAVRDDGTIFVTTFFTDEVRWYEANGTFIAGWTGGDQIRGIEFFTPSLPGLFVRGDANGDGGTEIADAITILSALFGGGAPLTCEDAADVNDDGTVDLADPISLLAYLFISGAIPPSPFPLAGEDPTDDPLGC